MDLPLTNDPWTRRRLAIAWPAVVSAVLAISLYAVTLGGTYVYDDVAVVRNDPRVRQVDQWPKIFTRGYFDPGVDNLYRPIVSFGYAVEWYLHGDRAWAFHLVNILLNAAVTALVAEMTRRLVRVTAGGSASAETGFAPALIAGLLFAAHPVHVEAVANIVGRAELMSALLILTSICLLLRSPIRVTREMAISDTDAVRSHPSPSLRPSLGAPAGGGMQLVSLGIAVAALFCKEQAVLQPLFWLIGWLILFRRPGQRSGGVFLLLTCWIWAGYLVVREHFFKFEWDRSFLDISAQPMIASFGSDRVLMPVVLIGHYARLLVLPSNLSPDYGGDVIGSVVHLFDPNLWIGFGAVAVWTAAVTLAGIKKDRVILTCLLCFAAVYGMTGNIFSLIGTNLAERLLYLPTAFLAAAVGIFASKIPCKLRFLLLLPVLIGMSWQTFRYARLWSYPSELFSIAIETHPGSIQLYLLLSQEERNAGRYNEADKVLARACDRHPAYYRVWVERAENAMDLNDWSAAHLYLNIALRLGGNNQQIAAALADLDRREVKSTSLEVRPVDGQGNR